MLVRVRIISQNESSRVTVFGVERNAPGGGLQPEEAALNNSRQILHLSLAHELVQPADGELFKVRGSAMELTRRPVPVLLVDHHHGRIVLNRVRHITDTAGLLSGGEGQLAQNIAYIFAVFRGESHAYDKADHCVSNLPGHTEPLNSPAAS